MNKYLEKIAANPAKILNRVRQGRWGEGSKVFKGARNPKQSEGANLERLYDAQFKSSHKKPNFKKVMDIRGSIQSERMRRTEKFRSPGMQKMKKEVMGWRAAAAGVAPKIDPKTGKLMKKAQIENIKTEAKITDLRGDGRDALSQLMKTKRSVETFPRAKSLRETMDESARKSYLSSKSKGAGGQSVARAIRKMQEKASTPSSSQSTTKKRVLE